VGVAVAADDAAGLVHDEGELGLRLGLEGLALHGDLVGARHHLLAKGGLCAVHIDLAAGDQRLGGPARADAGLGDEFLDADGFHGKAMNGGRGGTAQRETP
jgi:hypothetical protein